MSKRIENKLLIHYVPPHNGIARNVRFPKVSEGFLDSGSLVNRIVAGPRNSSRSFNDFLTNTHRKRIRLWMILPTLIQGVEF